jgi:transposase
MEIRLIGDNLASHISLNVVQECQNNNIHFILLPPNSTCLRQLGTQRNKIIFRTDVKKLISPQGRV